MTRVGGIWPCPEVLCTKLETVFRASRQDYRHALRELREVCIGNPRGRRDQHFVARVEGRHQRVEEHLLTARAHGNVLGTAFDPVLAAEFLDDRRLQLGGAVDRRVVSLPRVHRAVRGLDDVVRRVEIGLALRQSHDVHAGGAQLANALCRRRGGGEPGARDTCG